MSLDYNSISVNYSDQKLRILVEEYLTMQRYDFTFKSLCSYILYWAKEEGQTVNVGIYESNELHPVDCQKVKCVLNQIIREGRIMVDSSDEMKYLITMNNNSIFKIERN